MLSDFKRIQIYYQWGWATKEQVGMYCYYGVITPEQYKLITGEDYEIQI